MALTLLNVIFLSQGKKLPKKISISKRNGFDDNSIALIKHLIVICIKFRIAIIIVYWPFECEKLLSQIKRHCVGWMAGLIIIVFSFVQLRP